MKAKVLSIALTLIALFVFGSAQAQNAHLAEACLSEGELNFKVAGLGNKVFTINVVVLGNIVCENDLPDQAKKPSVILERDFKTTKSKLTTDRNGRYNFSISESDLKGNAKCPGANGEGDQWEEISKTLEVSIEIYNDKNVLVYSGTQPVLTSCVVTEVY